MAAGPTSEWVVERIRGDVAERVPVDDRERTSVERFLAELDRLTGRSLDPLSQEADPVHVTGSGVVVGERGVLLHRHKRLGIWIQPGGHVDPGETPWDAARRETTEETGMRGIFAELVDDAGVPPLLHVDVHAGGRGHTHLDLRYLIDVGGAEPDPPDGESQLIAWFGWDEAIGLTDEGLAGLLRSLRP